MSYLGSHTFSNIKGRAGRLGQHHVGRVYLFNEPPKPEIMQVAPTLFGDDSDAPNDYVVHLDEGDLDRRADDRILELAKNLELDREGLKIASSIGLADALQLKALVNESLRRSDVLIWSRVPTYRNIRDTLDIICNVRNATKFGASSTNQLTYFIADLRQRVTMRDFLTSYDENFRIDMKFYENIFKFLRACEYGLPQLFSVVELFVKARGRAADYSFFLRDLSRWFRAEEIKNLDEEGIPIQISERLYVDGDTRAMLIARITASIGDSSTELDSFEKKWVAAALDLPYEAVVSKL
jgi:hypothetical protein